MTTETTQTQEGEGRLLNPEDAVRPEDVKLLEDGTAQIGDGGIPVEEVHDEDDPDELTAKRDAALDAAATEEERAKIRAERRDARKTRQLRAKEGRERMEREIEGLKDTANRLAQTVASLQNNALGQTLAQVDNEIAQSTQVMQQATAIEAEALTKGDGKTAVEAREAGLAARQRVQHLTALKQRAVQQTQKPAPLDPALERNAKAWRERHAWFNPNSGDDDSAVLTALDNSVAKAGFDPRTDAYWKELDARVAKHLPHRVSRGYNGAEGGAGAGAQGSPVAGASGNSGLAAGGGGAGVNGSGGAGYTLSAARVQAIKDAGKWDDPAERQKLIKKYRDYDTQQRH